MDRIKSGIPGLDKLLHGGIPKGQLLLLTGTAGTGKTIFGMQFAHAGAAKLNENAVYLSFEEPADALKANVAAFGWDLEALERAGKLTFIRYDPYRIEDAFDILESTIRETQAQRVVVDSISALGLYIRDKAELRKAIFDLSLTLRKLGVTPLLISEIVAGTKGLSRYGVEEFVADGVIVLYYERLHATFSRGLQVWKLRGSPHDPTIRPYEITDAGFSVHTDHEAFLKER